MAGQRVDLAPSVVDILEDAIDGKVKKIRPNVSNHQAQVLDVDEEGTVWVHILGGEDRTPIALASSSVERNDLVNVRIENNQAFLDGNVTSPAASVRTVNRVETKADAAQETAEEATRQALTASEAAQSAVFSAETAATAAAAAQSKADAAATAASDAQTSADSAATAASSAKTSADKANYALSDVEKVVGTVNWIAEHGEYVLTEDAAVDDSKVYYTRSGSGTEADPYAYAVVANPVDSDLSTYYELHIDESVQNYIASHLWLDGYGLNLSVDSANGYRIHQGTVDGTRAVGMYILNPNGYIVQTLNADGVTIGRDDESHIELDYHSMKLVDMYGSRYFHVSDLRGKDGRVSLFATFAGDGSTKRFHLSHRADAGLVVTVAGVVKTEDTDYTVGTVLRPDGNGSTYIEFAVPPGTNSEIEVSYQTQDAAYALTYGSRESDGNIGATSAAFGDGVTASGYASHAEGVSTKALSRADHAEGNGTVASGGFSHSEGHETNATGGHSHAEGTATRAAGPSSHAEGATSQARGRMAHAEGYETYAMGDASHAEGYWTATVGYASHAEGGGVNGYAGAMGRADGDYSHIEGYACNSSGESSHAEGNTTIAQGDNSHSQNLGTWAASDNQTALGKYNIGDTDGRYAVIVGNGEDYENCSNALTVDWNGNVVCNEVNGLALRSMGEIREASGSASVEKEANRNVADIRLPPGTWLVNARLQYPNNSTGRRAAKLSTTSEDGGNVISTDVRNAVSGALTQVQTERVFAIAADDVEGEEDGKMPVYLVGWQNSGSTLTCSGNIQAVRLSPAIGESYDGGGGGGEGGTSDYKELLNKPSIEGVTLVDDKTFPDLGLFIDAGEQYPQSDDYALTTLEINALWNNVMA